MVHVHKADDSFVAPAYAGRLGHSPVPKNRLPDGSASPDAVYRMIHDELLLDGSSRLNMATFVTTWMDPQAERLMAETFDKNMIDKDEYPQTAEIERRCVNIVADLFTLARADAGNYPVRRQPMYLDELVDEVVAAARIVASTRHVSIARTVPQSATYVGDEELIRRMVTNLLDNAVRHSRPGAGVRVDLSAVDSGYPIAVSDCGPGIPLENQPHIFERFYRVDPSRARGESDGGAGLGLALVRWIADLHGGTAALTSSSDKGSTFTVELPSPH